MINLIKSDLYRIKKEKSIFIILLAIIGVLLVEFLHAKTGVLGIRNVLATNSIDLINSDNIPLETLKSVDVLILLFLPVIISVFMVDFSTGTIRNSIISGYSRTNIYIGKIVSSSIICIALVIFYSLMSIIIGTLTGKFNWDISYLMQIVKVILIQLPLYIAAISFAYMIGVVTQSKSLVISVYLMYQIIVLILSRIFGQSGRLILNYEPISNLDKVPYVMINTFNDNLMFIMLGLIIIFVTTFIGIIKVRRMDIK